MLGDFFELAQGRRCVNNLKESAMSVLKKVLPCLLVSIGLLFLGFPVPTTATAQASKTVKFRMPYLECFQTTEHGEDEVYLVVTGQYSGGNPFQYRFPNETQHWDLNDGEGDPPVRDWPLINLEMHNGSSVDLIVLVMEEDGGTSGGWTRLGGSVVGRLNPQAGAIIGVIGSLINFQDSDDFIGAFSVHITNDNGNIITTFSPRDRVYDSSDPNSAWIRWNVNMNGDGSKYMSQFSVEE
jgi:hypothetical protein